MKQMMENLFKLQALEIQLNLNGPSDNKELKALRKTIPDPVLGHYDRMRVRGKKAVSAIRNNSCSECHMKVPTGTIVTLVHGTDIQLCGSCGRYLYLSESEAPSANSAVAPVESKPVKKRASRKAAANVT
jgi:predicted  nucleic acid-binding Zn-ribbon protein